MRLGAIVSSFLHPSVKFNLVIAGLLVVGNVHGGTLHGTKLTDCT
jgi:hypothetical protein